MSLAGLLFHCDAVSLEPPVVGDVLADELDMVSSQPFGLFNESFSLCFTDESIWPADLPRHDDDDDAIPSRGDTRQSKRCMQIQR